MVVNQQDATRVCRSALFLSGLSSGRLPFQHSTGHNQWKRAAYFYGSKLCGLPTAFLFITGANNVLEVIRVEPGNRFTIPSKVRPSGFVTIFINEKPMVSYKVTR